MNARGYWGSSYFPLSAEKIIGAASSSGAVCLTGQTHLLPMAVSACQNGSLVLFNFFSFARCVMSMNFDFFSTNFKNGTNFEIGTNFKNGKKIRK
jgi:hypothetical protein